MINTNELMLGNYVLHDDKPIKVKGIIENRIMSFANEIGVRLAFSIKIEDIYPILITEEILNKCGFYKHDIPPEVIFSRTCNSYYSNLQDDKINVYCGKNEEVFYYFVGVDRYFKYLHELQNIYFLYREEPLEVKF